MADDCWGDGDCHHNNFQLLNMNLNWILSVLFYRLYHSYRHLLSTTLFCPFYPYKAVEKTTSTKSNGRNGIILNNSLPCYILNYSLKSFTLNNLAEIFSCHNFQQLISARIDKNFYRQELITQIFTSIMAQIASLPFPLERSLPLSWITAIWNIYPQLDFAWSCFYWKDKL